MYFCESMCGQNGAKDKVSDAEWLGVTRPAVAVHRVCDSCAASWIRMSLDALTLVKAALV